MLNAPKNPNKKGVPPAENGVPQLAEQWLSRIARVERRPATAQEQTSRVGGNGNVGGGGVQRTRTAMQWLRRADTESCTLALVINQIQHYDEIHTVKQMRG